MKRYLDEHGPYMDYTNSLNNLHQEGYLRSFDYVEAYLPALPFHEIRKLYEREIGDLVSCLGPATLLPICLEGVYATLLREFGFYQQAADIQVRGLHYFQCTVYQGN
jgi:hypothetical protein